MCVFRDGKNFERFSSFIQGIVHLSILELKDLNKQLSKSEAVESKSKTDDASETADKKKEKDETSGKKKEGEEKDGTVKANEEAREVWDMQEKEKLFNFLSKLFLMNFPLYQVRTCSLKYFSC